MNKIKYLILLIIAVSFLFTNKAILNHVEHTGENFYVNTDKNDFPMIYDMLHETTPYISEFTYIPDIICISLLLCLLLNIKMLYKFIGLVISIFIIRTITISVTILPRNKNCGIIKNTCMFRGGCYDKIFSGHFSIVLLSLILLYENNYINLFLLIFINLLNALFIVLTRAHYTVDIIVALFITLFVYTNNLNICRILDKYM